MKNSEFALVKEMLETTDIIRRFDPSIANEFVLKMKSKKGLFLTGEGSSRIFPAKRAIYASLKNGYGLTINTDAATQSKEYNLADYAIFAASNSGQTKEVISFAMLQAEKRHDTLFGLTANVDTRLESLATLTHILNCGKEKAVAATKSVVEQALFYDAVLRAYMNIPMQGLDILANQIQEVLTATISPIIIDKISGSKIIYFAGRNTGVAEELALKTNEITRKKSAYLEGTFALHGIEEVMNSDEILIWVEPFESEVAEFEKRLLKGVGIDIVAISTHQTIFPTIIIPEGGEYVEYLQLVAGWNILVETGLQLKINLDKPERARKIGNEFIEE